MLLVIPVSRADVRLIPAVEKSFATFPPGVENDLLIVGSPNVRDMAETLADSLSKYFNTVTRHQFQSDNHLGWPMACNFYFQQTCYIIRSFCVEHNPWMWFELDCTPVANGWLSKIEAEYREAGSPFMGAKEKTIRGKNGVLLDDAGYHMVATGVYSSDVVAWIPSLGGVSATMLPWWEFLQWQIMPRMAETKLIQENWRTINYRRENSSIICDSDANLAWTIDYNKVILEDTVVVHGCKDGTLIDVLSHKTPTAIPAPPIVAIPRPIPSSRRMSKAARQARVERHEAQQLKDNGQS